MVNQEYTQKTLQKRLGVLTSGGDSPGMNAAVRAVVRTGLEIGADVYAIREGYQGMIDGGSLIQQLHWDDVGGILQLGGTIIGSARCTEFYERPGRLKAVANLLKHDIDSLVVIGGDGSLTGANLMRQEWSSLVQELVEAGEISQATADEHPFLGIAGLVGSIDNDMFGTDLTIGADSALHRIVDAVDAIKSTADSHQRTFIVEVMGRRCGYLALMGAIASSADYVIIPENPPELAGWEDAMCRVLSQGRKMGRRDSIIILAEGARDRQGQPITSAYLKEVITDKMDEEARITVLGHVQRGGSPSAIDRNLSTLKGVEATRAALEATAEDTADLIGIRNNQISRLPLMDCVRSSEAIKEAIQTHDYETAMELRGETFQDVLDTWRTLQKAKTTLSLPDNRSDRKPIRYAIINAGGLAPGMNAAVGTVVRIGLSRGHIPLQVSYGFQGLADNEIRHIRWEDAQGLTSRGGSTLGISQKVPVGKDLYRIARHLEEHEVDAIVMIGGWSGYRAALNLYEARENFSAFNIPMICIPASINNNLPGSEFSIGSDTAVNNIVDAVDKIKQSGVAARRCFIVDVMGRYCGYLAFTSGLATGAERVYLHEEETNLRVLQADLEMLVQGFKVDKGLDKHTGLIIRNENAHSLYKADFLGALFEEEGGDLFDVRTSVLGHLHRGGDPSPHDRIMATRMAVDAIDFLEDAYGRSTNTEVPAACIGIIEENMRLTFFHEIDRLFDEKLQRPKEQWWMRLRDVARMLAQPHAQYINKVNQ